MADVKELIGNIKKVLIVHNAKLYMDFDVGECTPQIFDLSPQDGLFFKIESVTRTGATTYRGDLIACKVQSETGAPPTTGAFITAEQATNYDLQQNDIVQIHMIRRVR